ncbi:MAG: hybrid sensor histidine kinase/response regulator [Cyanobacteria bacterium P01_F01_bin.150]
MSTEEQARRHFLEEAETYFEQIETVILNLNASDQPVQDLDMAMRAAHSVKGTAAMMGFMPLSHVAHQLEDYFKILRARNLNIETQVETLLLQGLDGLRAIRKRLYEGRPIEDKWQQDTLTPIFDQLRLHLGELTPEDEDSLLSDEADVDVSVMVFSNGVEEYLDQLDNQRSHLSGEALRQELITGAGQLLDYGLMAEMGAFIELCQSVLTYSPMIADVDLDSFADSVIQAWQRSHSLVLLGRTDQLPASLDMDQFSLNSVAVIEAQDRVPHSLADIAIPDDLLSAQQPEAPEQRPYPIEPISDDYVETGNLAKDELSQLTAQLNQLDLDHLDDLPEPSSPEYADGENMDAETAATDALPEIDPGELLALTETLENLDLSAPSAFLSESVEPVKPVELVELVEPIEPIKPVEQTQAQNVATTVDAPEESPEEAPEEAPVIDGTSGKGVVDMINTLIESTQSARLPIDELGHQQDSPLNKGRNASNLQSAETSVRIPVSQLHAINQLLNTLLLDRNAISLRVEQLKTFSELLKQRVGEIDNFNIQLRQWYDRASIESANQISAPSTGQARQAEIQPSMQPGISGASLSSSITATLALSRIQSETQQKMQGFDTLEMDQYSALHLLAQDKMESIVKLQEVAADIDLGVQEIGRAAGRLNYTSRSLQDQVSRTQMRPFEDIVGRFPRLIRDLSVQYGKQVKLKIDGSSTLFERYALDRLTDPLIHLLRNAFDHGIESPDARQQQGKSAEGQIYIKAINRGNRAVITISDDGKGIDLDKICDRVRNYGIPNEQIQQMSRQELLSMIFEPGFSTAEQVTDLSGRGVGMDVVRANLEPIKGDIQVDTTLGQGTTFTIAIPLSLSVVRVMLLEHQSMVFALTIDDVQEMIPFSEKECIDAQNPDMMQWKDRSIPLVRLEDYLQFNSRVRPAALAGTPTIDRPIVVIVGDTDNCYGLLLKRFWKEQDAVMQPIATPIPLPPGFSGATVLGDGRIIPLMDSQQLEVWFKKKQAQSQAKDTQETPDEQIEAYTDLAESLMTETVEPLLPEIPDSIDLQTVLIVDDSIHARQYLAISLEKAGYLTEQAKDGQEALDLLNAGLEVQAVICDVEMPRVDGYGVLDNLRSQPQFQDLPILMLTSRSSNKHRKLAMNLGASAYFSKPYNEQELMQNLAALMQAQV